MHQKTIDPPLWLPLAVPAEALQMDRRVLLREIHEGRIPLRVQRFGAPRGVWRVAAADWRAYASKLAAPQEGAAA
jgi:hypothetical protein